MSKPSAHEVHTAHPPKHHQHPVVVVPPVVITPPVVAHLFRPPVRSDVPPELPVKQGEEPTEEQKAKVIREAVNFYLRTSLRAPDVRAICEAFITGIDATYGGPAPLPDVPGVSVSPIGVLVPRVGAEGDIFVTITSPGASGTWTVDKDSTADWLTYEPMTPQATDGVVHWVATDNSGGDPRTANLYINGKTFYVEQDGKLALAGTAA